MKIVIMGTPVSSGNRGVLALGASLVNLCSMASQGRQVVLLLNHRNSLPVNFRINGVAQAIPVVPARLSPKSHPRDHLAWILILALAYRLLPLPGIRAAIIRSSPWLRTIHEARFVGGVHGGDSFSDIYGLRRFLLGFLLDWSVLLVKGSMVQFPQTYGPYKSPIARSLARYLLRRSSVIIARDKQSLKVAQELVGGDRKVLLSPDVAFSLETIRPDSIEVDPPLSGSIPSGIIGLNVNGLMYNGGYTRNNMFGLKLDYAAMLPALVSSLLQVHPGELWLVPHTFATDGNVESDPEASRKLRDSLPSDLRHRVRIVTREYDQHEIKGVIGACAFFIGSRMHACIAALSQGIPCVGIAYSMKFRGVFESVGMEDWVVDARSSSNEQAIARTLELYQLRHTRRDALKLQADEARHQLQDIFQKLVSL